MVLHHSSLNLGVFGIDFNTCEGFFFMTDCKCDTVTGRFAGRKSLSSNIYILIVLSLKMAAPMSKRDVDVFDNSDVESDIFSLENTTWIRLEEQKHKVDIGCLFVRSAVI